MHPVLRELGADRALKLAYLTSAIVVNVVSVASGSDTERPVLSWPSLRSDPNEDELPGAIAAKNLLAPFVRGNPDAPPEALYIHARDEGVHNNEATWATLPIASQFGYGFFQLALLYADRMIAADTAAKAAAPQAQPGLTIENYTHTDEAGGPGDVIDRPPGAPTSSAPTAKQGGTGIVKTKKPADPKRGAHGQANKKAKKKARR